MQFKISGTDRRTGQTIEALTLDAADYADAADQAVRQGVFVTNIECRGEGLPPPVFAQHDVLPPPIVQPEAEPRPQSVRRGAPRQAPVSSPTPASRLSTPRRAPPTTPCSPEPDPDRPFDAKNEYPLLNFYRYFLYFLGTIACLVFVIGFFFAFSGGDQQFTLGVLICVQSLLSALGAFSIAQLIELSFRLLESMNYVQERLARRE